MQTLERHTPVQTGRLASKRLDDDFALGVQREVVGFEQVTFIEGGQVVDVDLSCLRKTTKHGNCQVCSPNSTPQIKLVEFL